MILTLSLTRPRVISLQDCKFVQLMVERATRRYPNENTPKDVSQGHCCFHRHRVEHLPQWPLYCALTRRNLPRYLRMAFIL